MDNARLPSPMELAAFRLYRRSVWLGAFTGASVIGFVLAVMVNLLLAIGH